MDHQAKIGELLGDFLAASGGANKSKDRPVTLWLPPEVKASYDKLQEKSDRRFGKKAREIFIELITVAEQKI